MKNKFNFKLFLDGMRQLCTIGIMGLVVFCIEAVFSVIGENIGIQQQIEYSSRYNLISDSAFIRTFNLCSLHPFLYAAFYVLVPVMILYLFGFLNRRNGSDYYHSAPVKRECLALSLLASIMAWILIIILSSTALVCIITAFAPYVSLNMYSVFVSLLATIVGCLCVLGAGFLAMSLTGTYFSNFAVSVMLLVFPRLIVMVYIGLLSDILPIMSFSFEGGLLDYRLNIVTGSALGLLENEASYPMEHFLPVLYTFILSLVYFAAGFYAFIHRKSEIATMPAGNSVLQLIFRLIPPMAICLIPIYALVELLLGDSSYGNADYTSTIFYIVLSYVIAIVAYFLYELISTKKIANVLKSARQLWVLVVFNIVFLAMTYIGYNVLLGDIPEKEDIKYVSISTANERQARYFSGMASEAHITNPEVINYFADTLSDNIRTIKDKSAGYGWNNIIVDFRVNGRTIRRTLTLKSEAEYNYCMSLLGKADEYANVYRILPEYDRIKDMSFYSTGIDTVNLSDSDMKEVYNVLCEDMKALNFSDAYKHTNDYRSIESFGTFRGTYSNKSDNYIFTVNISDLTPNAAMLIIKKVNAQKTENPLTKFLNGDGLTIDGTVKSIAANFTLYDKGEFIYGSAGRTITPESTVTDFTNRGADILREMSKELDKTANTEITSLGKPIVAVEYCNETTGGSYLRYYTATDKFCELFYDYTGRNKK